MKLLTFKQVFLFHLAWRKLCFTKRHQLNINQKRAACNDQLYEKVTKPTRGKLKRIEDSFLKIFHSSKQSMYPRIRVTYHGSHIMSIVLIFYEKIINDHPRCRNNMLV